MTLGLGHVFISLLVCSKEVSTLGTGFALGAISSACSLLRSCTAGLHSLQELLPVLLARWGWKALSIVSGAVTQHPAWARADWALGLAELLA